MFNGFNQLICFQVKQTQMEMRDDDAVEARSQGGAGLVAADVAEIGEPSLVVEAHVHAAVQHDPLATHGHQQARSANILT